MKKKHDLKKHFLNWKPIACYRIPLARNPKEKKKTKEKIKKEIKNKKKQKETKRTKQNVTVMQFLPNHRYAIHVWKMVPRNHDVVICTDIFFTCL